jgi:hypothetical protein
MCLQRGDAALVSERKIVANKNKEAIVGKKSYRKSAREEKLSIDSLVRSDRKCFSSGGSSHTATLNKEWSKLPKFKDTPSYQPGIKTHTQMKRVMCKSCGKPFALSHDHQTWFKERNLSLPKRCLRCLRNGEQDKPKRKKISTGPKKPRMRGDLMPTAEDDGDSSGPEHAEHRDNDANVDLRADKKE